MQIHSMHNGGMLVVTIVAQPRSSGGSLDGAQNNCIKTVYVHIIRQANALSDTVFFTLQHSTHRFRDDALRKGNSNAIFPAVNSSFS